MEPLSPKSTIRELLTQLEDCCSILSKTVPSSCLPTWNESMAKWHQPRNTILASGNADLPLEALPSDAYQELTNYLGELKQMLDDDRKEEIRQQEDKARKQVALRNAIASEFPSTTEDKFIPLEVLICSGCRENGHPIADCSSVSDSKPREITIRDVQNSFKGIEPSLDRPKKIIFKPRVGTDAALPCSRCDNIPLTGLFAGAAGCPLLTRSHGWVDSLRFRQDCPMCVVLLNTMPSHITSKHGYVILCALLSFRRQLGRPSTKLGENRILEDVRSLCAAVNDSIETEHDTWVDCDLGRIIDAPCTIQKLWDQLGTRNFQQSSQEDR